MSEGFIVVIVEACGGMGDTKKICNGCYEMSHGQNCTAFRPVTCGVIHVRIDRGLTDDVILIVGLFDDVGVGRLMTLHGCISYANDMDLIQI